MPIDKLKILYIAGWGRSGSTILSSILGQIEGFFSTGELHFIWKSGFIENRRCGCGLPFRECDIWRRVLEEAFGGLEYIDPREMIHLGQSVRSRHLLLMMIPQARRLLVRRLKEYLDRLEKLYQSISWCTNSKVIVDSSKLPSYGYMLGSVPSVDLYVVHLVRDSRAVAYSWWRRSKFQLDSTGNPVYLKQRNPVESSLVSDIWNVAIETLWQHIPGRYLRLRYEDFIDKPQDAIGRILSLVDEKPTFLPFIDERKIELRTNHTVSGNPNRFQTGTVELSPDDEWKKRMTRSERVIVSLLTWPLLLRYGYLGGE
jgi:hypothetical protein